MNTATPTAADARLYYRKAAPNTERGQRFTAMMHTSHDQNRETSANLPAYCSPGLRVVDMVANRIAAAHLWGDYQATKTTDIPDPRLINYTWKPSIY